MKKHYLWALVTAVFLYFTYFWFNVIAYDEAGSLMVRQSNMWADWALHFTFGSAFAERGMILAQNPLMVGTPMVYPPAAGWLSAFLIKLGMPFFLAFILPSYIFTLGLVAVLYYFFCQVLSSVKTALTATVLFLLNGGLGFIYFFQDIIESRSPLKTMLFPPREYTDLEPDAAINFMNFLTSMIYPQRSFTFGFTLVMIALSIIFVLLIKKKVMSPRKRRLLLATAAIILGISPLIHPHSSLAAAIILISWFLLTAYENRKLLKKGKLKVLKSWLKVGLASLSVALSISLVFFLRKVDSGSFLRFNPGFLSPESGYSWPVYWLMNWGVVPLLAAAGVYLSWKSDKKIYKYLTPFLLIFAAANIWQFQPWMWDNMKLLAWSAVGVCGLAALTLRWLWQQNNPAARTLTLILFSASILSGITEAVRTIQFSNFEYTMYTREELELADWVKSNTEANSVWLTSDKPNNWAYNLTGRQPIMAYPGWLSSHGLENYQNVQQNQALVFAQPESSTNLLKKYQVRYAVIGPSERQQWQAQPNKFAENFKLIKETDNYQIFELTEK